MPDRSKQHTRRLPPASILHALTIRRARVSGRLAEVIHWIQSLRATGVILGPQGPCLWRVGQCLAKIGRNTGFELLSARRDLKRHDVAGIYARGVLQRLVHLEPMTLPAVRLQRCLECTAIEGACNRGRRPRREFRAGAPGQDEECPGTAPHGRAGRKSLVLKRIVSGQSGGPRIFAFEHNQQFQCVGHALFRHHDALRVVAARSEVPAADFRNAGRGRTPECRGPRAETSRPRSRTPTEVTGLERKP